MEVEAWEEASIPLTFRPTRHFSRRRCQKALTCQSRTLKGRFILSEVQELRTNLVSEKQNEKRGALGRGLALYSGSRITGVSGRQQTP